MCNKQKVLQIIKCIEAGVSRLPLSKQHSQMSKVAQITNKFPNPQQQQFATLYKQLKFRLDFLKLAYPSVSFEASSETTQPSINPPQKNQQSPLFGSSDPSKPAKQPKRSDVRFENKVFQQKLTTPNESTTFVMKDGKLVPGTAEKRKQVDFTNWYQGNADPQVLQRHKQLLDRQHFKGPLWQQQEKPKPAMMKILEAANESKNMGSIKVDPSSLGEPQKPSSQPTKQEMEARFEKVKR